MDKNCALKSIFFGVSLVSAAVLSAQTYTESYWTGKTVSSRYQAGSTQNPDNFTTGAIPDANTNLIFDKAQLVEGYTAPSILTDNGKTLTVHDFTVLENYVGMTQNRMQTGSVLDVKNDMNLIGRSVSFFYDDAHGAVPVIKVGNNLNMGSAAYTGSQQGVYRFTLGRGNENAGWGPVNLYVGNDFVANTYSKVYLDGATKTEMDVTSANAATTAQVYIGGVMNFVGGSNNPEVCIVSRAGSETVIPYDTINVVSANGLTGKGVIKAEGNTNASSSYVGVLHLRNSADQTFNGWIMESSTVSTDEATGVKTVTKTDNAKIKVIMDATNANATQKFTDNRLYFTGGVEVRNGTLAMNAGYDYNGYKASDNHGDLVMNGGTFKAMANSGRCQFGFNEFEYTAGTIDLTIFATTGYGLKLYSESASIYFGSDALGSAVVDFYLTAGGTADLIDGNYYKIVDWVVKSDLTAEQFSANTIGEYQAEFDVRDDGLYVRYVNAVPEPATYAAIFGLFALGFVAYRRRR